METSTSPSMLPSAPPAPNVTARVSSPSVTTPYGIAKNPKLSEPSPKANRALVPSATWAVSEA